jgi:hypothetical protein
MSPPLAPAPLLSFVDRGNLILHGCSTDVVEPDQGYRLLGLER